MTGNTAQQFTSDEEWRTLLEQVHDLLAREGHFIFETRNPASREWETWTRDATTCVSDLPDVGTVETWTEVTDADLPLVTFRSSWTFASDHTTLTSDSTLRFRELDEIRADLTTAGFTVAEVLDAPDRPGQEFVVVATPNEPELSLKPPAPQDEP